MNYNLIKCLPVFVLAMSLSACGNKQAANKSGGGQGAAVTAPGLSTQFQADCGADAAAASANAAFDLSQCQLSPAQMALLQEVGPFKVDADCVHESVVIKNSSEQIAAQGSINPDGTFNVPFTVGDHFSQLEGCPVKLEGLASGKVACDENKKVAKVDVNTTFTFSPVTENSALAMEFALDDSQPAPAPAPAPSTQPAPVPAPAPAPAPTDDRHDRDGDHHDRDGDHHDRDGKGGKGGSQEKGGTVPAPAQEGKGKTETGKGGVVVPSQEGKGGQSKGGTTVPAPTQEGKGKGGVVTPSQEGKGGQSGKGGVVVPSQEGKGGQAGKGGQTGKGGQSGNIPGRHVDACVSFSPCGFSTNAALSCGR